MTLSNCLSAAFAGNNEEEWGLSIHQCQNRSDTTETCGDSLYSSIEVAKKSSLCLLNESTVKGVLVSCYCSHIIVVFVSNTYNLNWCFGIQNGDKISAI